MSRTAEEMKPEPFYEDSAAPVKELDLEKDGINPHRPGPRKNVFWTVAIFVIIVEAANMFAFYGGLKDWLNWYVGAYLGVDNTDAQTLYLAFNSFTYIMPILSGIACDLYLGSAKTVYLAGSAYVGGLLILLVSTIINNKLVVAGGSQEEPIQAGVVLYYIGSFVAAFGSGAIKPAIVVLGADQYNMEYEEEAVQRGSYYTLFYVTVQVGGFVAGYFPMLVKKEDFGPELTIALTTSMLAASLAVLVMFRNRFIVKPCKSSETLEVIQVIGSGVARSVAPCAFSKKTPTETQIMDAPKESSGFGILDRASNLFGGPFDHDRVAACKQIVRMLPVWSTQIMIMLVYQQGATYWVSEGWQMNDTVFDSNTLNSVFDPFFCALFMLTIRYVFTHPSAPLANWLESRGWQLTGLRQMGIGIIPFTAAMIAAGALETKRKNSPLLYGPDGEVVLSQYGAPKHDMSVFWMLIPTALGSLGESFCFVGIMDFFYSEAPDGLKTISTAIGMFTSAVASWVGIVFSQGFKSWVGNDLDDSRLAQYNYVIAGISGANFLWFLVTAYLYRRTNPYRGPLTELSANKHAAH